MAESEAPPAAAAVTIERGKHGPLVGAVDQGTSSTRFLVSDCGEIVY